MTPGQQLLPSHTLVAASAKPTVEQNAIMVAILDSTYNSEQYVEYANLFYTIFDYISASLTVSIM
jgi:hypothetical protein